MASLNYKEIEQKLEKLKDNTNPEEIGYLILSAFGTTDTYIRRYKSGKGNMSQNGGILVKKSLAFKSTSAINLTEVLEDMKKDEHIARQKARILAVSDGKTILAFDPLNNESYENRIEKLWFDFQFFFPLGGVEKYVITQESPADVKAAEKMARLHNEIRRYNEYSSEADLHDLNLFMTRLLFCFFAEDTAIFEKGIFSDFIRRYTLEDGSNLSDSLDEVFNVLDDPYRVGRTKVFAQFPYVNGGLFNTRISIPKMGMKSRKLMLECSELNWGEINPDIFGSMMQAVVTPELRGGLGMHYTSVPNIMKVIHPLFLNDLEEAFADSFDNAKKLDQLLIRISKIKFFDPACGSGNFLIITYKELRRLEIRIWKRIAEITGLRLLPYSNISIHQFHGIELDSFAHEIAMLSLWLAEHQMNAEFSRTFTDVKIDALPLKNINTIVQANACRVVWNEVCPHKPEEEVYVFGNPPYLGSRRQSLEQKKDISFLFKENYGDLDYISCWFYLGAKYIENTKAKYAFVSTNSICQGEQTSLLWKRILNDNIIINFAHTSFKWANNAKYNAGVTVIIVGVANKQDINKYVIYENSQIKEVSNISPLLIDAPTVYVETTRQPISKNFPQMNFGNMPADGGKLILSNDEKETFLDKYPDASKFIKPLISADEFLNGKKRWCIWLKGENENEYLNIDGIKERIEELKVIREKSSRPQLASIPHLFAQITQPLDVSFILIPRHSSENRDYIPIGFFDKTNIAHDSCLVIGSTNLWLFGVLTSKMHMAWVKTVGGRLKTDFRYSAQLCYNTFPFPTISEVKKKEIEALAEEVLLTRQYHTEKTLAQMYNPEKMPKDLREAHNALDIAVDSCYPGAPFDNDEERLEVLFKMYEKMRN